MSPRSILFVLRKRTVERYTEIVAINPMSWDDILKDLEAVQKEITRVGSKCYTTVDDFEVYVERSPQLKLLFSKTTSAPKKKFSRARDYYNRNPDKYKEHIEKMKSVTKTPEQKEYIRAYSALQNRRNATVERYICMIRVRGHMTYQDILTDLENVQGILNKFGNPRYTTAEDFEKYIGNKIRTLNTYDKVDTSNAAKLIEMINKI